MDHPGPMASCVRDLAILLQTIAGFDQGDSTSRLQLDIDLLAAVDGEIKPPALGRLRGLFEERAEPAVRRMMDQVVKELTERGCEIVDVALPAGFAEVIARHRIVMAVEAAQFHEQRLRKHPQDYGPNITKLLEEGIACPAAEFARTKEHQKRLRDELGQSLGIANPILLCPATPGPAPDKATTGDPVFNSPWSYTGMPTVSFPVGLSDDGLPLAIQMVGAQMYEDKLFQTAAWCEQVFAGRMPEPPIV